MDSPASRAANASVRGDHNIRRLQIAMDNPLLMRVLHRLADLGEQLQALGDAQLLRVTVFGDRDALDVFHHEVRAAMFGQTAV